MVMEIMETLEIVLLQLDGLIQLMILFGFLAGLKIQKHVLVVI